LDYSLNDKHAIGGQYEFYARVGKDFPSINTETYLNNVLHETSQSQAYRKDKDYQHLVNAFYNGDFNERFSLRFDFDYLKSRNDNNQHSDESVNSAQANVVEIFNQTDYDLYAGKLTSSWKTGVGLVEFGGEYNNIAGDGFVRSNGATDNSEFTNNEQKAAGFIGYSHKLAEFILNPIIFYK
jgi:hypothetical protein